MIKLTQKRADKLYATLRHACGNVVFEPSDVFEGLLSCIEQGGVDLGKLMCEQAINILKGLEVEQSWTEIGFEIYRRTFYDVENLKKSGLQVDAETGMVDLDLLTFFLIQSLADTPVNHPAETSSVVH